MWAKQKPEITSECVLLISIDTAIEVYQMIWQIDYESDAGYWALCDLDGEEVGAYEELVADYYMIVDYPESEAQNEKN